MLNNQRIFILIAFAVFLIFGGKLHAVDGLEFVENQGQWHENIRYQATLNGGMVYAENDGIKFLWKHAEDWSKVHPYDRENPQETLRAHAYKVKFIGGQAQNFTPKKPYDHYYNYFLGNDESKWASGLHPHSQLRYGQIYDGIDMLLYGKNGNLKYDFKIAPNADPSQIALQYDGVDNLRLDGGNLVVGMSVGELVELAPYAYQLISGKIVEIPCAFVLDGLQVRFELGAYDVAHALVIDPELAWSSYIGAGSDNWGSTATNDSEGNLIGSATTFGPSYPTSLGAFDLNFSPSGSTTTDLGISKFSANGSALLFSTFLGGFGEEIPHSITVNSIDEVIVLGNTGSTNFPTTFNSFQGSHAGGPTFSFSQFFQNFSHTSGTDLFVSRISPDGTNLFASSYLGGSDTDGLNVADKLMYNYGDAFRGEVLVDAEDNIIVATITSSSDFPVPGPGFDYGGGSDGVVVKINTFMTEILWGSYVGGTADDAALSAQVDSNGNIFVTGGTKSTSVPFSTAGAYQSDHSGDVDGFICKFNNEGQPEIFTYTGTGVYDQSYFVQLDENDDVFIFGQSEGDIPVTAGVYSNANSGQFIQKFNNDLTNLEMSTVFGGGSGAIDISPTAFLVSECNQIYLVGWGGSTNRNFALGSAQYSGYAEVSTTLGLPITPDAFQSNTDGSDFYMALLEADATDISYATFFGGSLTAEHVDGGTSKFDKKGNVYQAVCAGCGGSDNFPTSPGAWSETNGSSNCNLGVFKFDLGSFTSTAEIGEVEDVICQNAPIFFENNSEGADFYTWIVDNGVYETNDFEFEYTFEETGVHDVELIASSDFICNTPDTIAIQIDVVFGPLATSVEPEAICPGASTLLQGNSNGDFYWGEDPTLTNTTTLTPTASPAETTTYWLYSTNLCGIDSVSVEVEVFEPEIAVGDSLQICLGQGAQLSAGGAASYSWEPAALVDNPNIAAPLGFPTEDMIFTVSVITDEGCDAQGEIYVDVVVDFPGGNIYDTETICIGQQIQMQAIEGISFLWSPTESLSNPNVVSPIASPETTTTYTIDVTNLCGTGQDQVTVVVIEPDADAIPSISICEGTFGELWATGGVSYQWTPEVGIGNSSMQNPLVSPSFDLTYTVYVTDEFGCTASATSEVNVLDGPYVNAGPDSSMDFLEGTTVYGQAEGVDFWWEPAEFMECPNCLISNVNPPGDMHFVLYSTDVLGCTSSDTVFVEAFGPIYVPNSFTPNADGINDTFKVIGPEIEIFSLEIYNRWGQVVFKSEDINEGWNGAVDSYLVEPGVYSWKIIYDIYPKGLEALTGHVTVIR